MLFVMNYKKFCLGWMSSVVIRNEEEVLVLQAGNVLLMGHGASATAAVAVIAPHQNTQFWQITKSIPNH